MISVCIITKNECDKLEKCLISIRKYMDCEIVVVDTGSSDESIRVAEKYADVVVQHKWNDDFAEARNYAISLASNDLILSLDTDEEITSFDAMMVNEQFCNNPYTLGRICCVSPYRRDGQRFSAQEYISRLFDRRYYRYSGRVHEQLVCLSGDENDGTSWQSPISILHSGYDVDEDARKEKARRNQTLLESEYQANPNDPYIIYQLGQNYYFGEDDDNALRMFEQLTFFDLDTQCSWVIDFIVNYGLLLIKKGQNKWALNLESLWSELGNIADYCNMMGHVYMNNGLFDKAIDAFIKATNCERYTVVGTNSFLSFYNAGVVSECTGDVTMAYEFYSKCGDYPLAKTGLERLKNNKG